MRHPHHNPPQLPPLLALGAVYQTPSGSYVRVLAAIKHGDFVAVRVHLHHVADLPGQELYVSQRRAVRLKLAWAAEQWAAKQADRLQAQEEIARKLAARDLRDAQDASRSKAIDFEAKAQKAYDQRIAREAKHILEVDA